MHRRKSDPADSFSVRPTGRFRSEQKEEILRQVDAGRTRVEVARQYGLNPVTISRTGAAAGPVGVAVGGLIAAGIGALGEAIGPW